MSELIDCINNLSAKDIIKSAAKTANVTPFYLQTVGGASFSPADIAGLEAWFDASLGITGDPVSAWIDQTGNGHDLSNIIGADQPDFVPNAVNGLPGVEGDGTSDELIMAASISEAGNFTLFLVMGGDAGPGFMLGHSSTLYFRYLTGILTWRNSTTHSFDHTNRNLDTGYFLHRLIRDTGQVRSYRDNVESVTGAVANAVQMTITHMFSYGAANWGDGAVAEFLVYDSALSPANITAVEGYLNAKYAL